MNIPHGRGAMITEMSEVIGVEYFYVINGEAPELFPDAAYRKTVKNQSRELKEIKCPHCGRFFTTVSASARVELFRNPQRKGVNCHTVRKCRICHGDVGLILS
jgi:hypothetical protein